MPPKLSVEIIEFDLLAGFLNFNLGITHPFPNTDLRLFDVRGIMMGAGATVASKADPYATYGATNGFRILNSDGLTRWWNGLEFSTPGFFGFEPGDFGADFVPAATLNPYKYYSDPLGVNDPVVPGVNFSNRGTFSTDFDPPMIARNFQLQMPMAGGPVWLIQYAVDANWTAPTGDSPTPKPIDDFPLEANCPEAFHVEVDTLGTTAFYVNDGEKGGDLVLAIEVFDWGAAFNPDGIDGEVLAITVESETLFDFVAWGPPESNPGSQAVSGIYNITIPDVHPTGLENQRILVTVKSANVTSYISPIGFPEYPVDAELAAYVLVDIPIAEENPYTGYVNVLSPNGGETWHVGDEAEITWEADPLIENVKIELSKNSGADYSVIVAESTVNSGTFTWESIPADAVSGTCRIKISDTEVPSSSDESDADFAIESTPLELLSPNGGDEWFTETSMEIEWEGGLGIENVSIALSLDSGENYTYLIETSTENDGSYMWGPIPGEVIGENIRIKIKEAGVPDVSDESDLDFSIQVNPITIITPNGGETWQIGTSEEIVWNAEPGIADVKIWLSVDSGETFDLQVSNGTPNDGSFTWEQIPVDAAGNNCRIKIRNAVHANAFRISDADFTILPDPLTVFLPNGGEAYEVGQPMEITWGGAPFTTSLVIKLSKNGGTTFPYTISDYTGNDGSLTWDPITPEAVSTNCVIRISDAYDPTVLDFSDNSFLIEPAPINVLTPNGGEIWGVAECHEITWFADPDILNIMIELSLNSGADYATLVSSTANDGSWEWMEIPPSAISEHCRIRISDVDNSIVYDDSDSDFAVIYVTPMIDVLSPDGGEILEGGSTYEVTWSTLGWIGDSVRIEYTLFDGFPNTIISSTPNDGSCLWNPIPVIDSDTVRVRITSVDYPLVYGESESYFTIQMKDILVISPNGGEAWGVGGAEEIVWEADPSIANVIIEISKDSGANYTYTATPTTPNDGSFILDPVPSELVGTHNRVRISDVNDLSAYDTSNGDFSCENSWIKVTSPNGGENWSIGLAGEITWDSSQDVDYVTIKMSLDSGLNYTYLISQYWPNTGSFIIDPIPLEMAGAYNRIRISNVDNPSIIDASDADFLVADSWLDVINPNGGEEWHVGYPAEITWDSHQEIEYVTIKISLDSGVNYTYTVAPYTSNTGSFVIDYIPHELVGFQNRVRISDADDPSTLDASDADFTCVSSWIDVTSPNGGEIWDAGESAIITWDAHPDIENVTIKISKDSGANYTYTVSPFTENDGSFLLDTIPVEIVGSHNRVRISDSADPSTLDASDVDFEVTGPWIEVTGPNGGEVWDVGYPAMITWDAHPTVENVLIKVSTDSGANYTYTVSPYTENDGVFLLNPVPPEISGTQCRVRISDAVNPSVLDASDADFSSLEGWIEVTSPNGGETWQVEESGGITWTSHPDIAFVTIKISTDSGTHYNYTVTPYTENDGSFILDPIPPDIASTHCRVRINDADNVSTLDASDANFSIGGLDWPVTWGGTGSDVGTGVAADNDENIYVVGRTELSGLGDCYFAKYNSIGNLLWERIWGGSSDDGADRICIDASGSIIIGGTFQGTIDFDTGGTNDFLTSNGGKDAWLCKYNSGGTYLWGVSYGSATGDDKCYGIVAVGTDIYVSGNFTGSNVDFDPGSGTEYRSSSGSTDIYLTKFNGSGEFQWVQTLGSSSEESAYYLATDDFGNLGLAGKFSGTMDFDPGAGDASATPSGNSDAFVAVYDIFGAYQWVQTWGGADVDAADRLAFDQIGSVYVTGWFNGTTDLIPGPPVEFYTSNGGADIFLSKFDSAGNFMWTNAWGSAASSSDLPYSVHEDGSGLVCVAGYIAGDTDFDPGPGIDTKIFSGGKDFFFAGYNASGQYQGAVTWGGSGDDKAYDMVLANPAIAFVTGHFEGTVDLDPGPAIEMRTSNGGVDGFITRFIVDLPEPEKIIEVLSPNGGEHWSFNTQQSIEWDWSGSIPNVDIDLSLNGGSSFDITLATGIANTGEFEVTVDPAWDSDIARILVTSSSDAGVWDVSDGDFRIWDLDSLAWAVHAGGTDNDRGSCVTTLSDNSVVVSGKFTGSATFGEGTPNETYLTSHGGEDIFLARYNPDGSLEWVSYAGGASNDVGCSITALSDTSIVVTGWAYSGSVFGEGEPNETVIGSNGVEDMFVARYYSDGSFAWVKTTGGIGHDEGYGITTLSDDSVVLTGSFRDEVVFGDGDPNETTLESNGAHSDIFVARYNADGTLAWAKRAGGNDYDVGLEITALSDDSTVATGFFQNSGVFGVGDPNQTTLGSYGAFDSFVARYNANGTLAWAKHSGGTASDAGQGVTALSDDSTVVTGYFASTATFGDGEPNETVIGSYGSNDIYIARYKPDGTLAWAKHAGGTDSDTSNDITILADDSTVLTGYFIGDGTFGSSDPYETVLTSYGADDIYIATYNPDGSLAWVYQAGGVDSDCGWGITVLSDDSTIVTGAFTTSAIFGEGEPNETSLVSYGGTDIFVARYVP